MQEIDPPWEVFEGHPLADKGQELLHTVPVFFVTKQLLLFCLKVRNSSHTETDQ